MFMLMTVTNYLFSLWLTIFIQSYNCDIKYFIHILIITFLLFDDGFKLNFLLTLVIILQYFLIII